jgi:hypothetical protein
MTPPFYGPFYDVFSILDYAASSGRPTGEKLIRKDLEGSARGLIEVLSRNLPAGGC